jgi:hypothetical protein
MSEGVGDVGKSLWQVMLGATRRCHVQELAAIVLELLGVVSFFYVARCHP